jgi:hypothetical protein
MKINHDTLGDTLRKAQTASHNGDEIGFILLGVELDGKLKRFIPRKPKRAPHYYEMAA